jgi:hypothetical protein
MASSRNKIFFLFIIASFLVGCGSSSDVATLTISPTTATIGINQSLDFNAVAQNSAGYFVYPDVTWSVDSVIGTINSANGLFKAGSSAGVGNVTAVAGGVTATAAVTITDTGWISGKLTGGMGMTNNIKVYLASLQSIYAMSGSDGLYTLSNVPAGTYTIKTDPTSIYQAGTYESVTVTRGGTTSGIDIYLSLQPGVIPVPTTTLPVF